MNYLLIFCAAASFCLNGSTLKLFQIKYQKSKASIALFQGGFCLTASVLYMLFGGFKAVPMPITVILGIAFGAGFMIAVSLNTRCFEIGPMSLTTVISSMSLALPLAYSCIFLNEKISLFSVIGLILLLITLILSAAQSGKSKKNDMSLKWFVLAFLLFIMNGLTATIQKYHLLHAGREQNMIFLAIAYFTSFLLFGGRFFLLNKGSGFNIDSQMNKPLQAGGIILLSGIGTCLGNGLLGHLSTVMPAALLYPVQNSAFVIFNSMVSVSFFKEKLTAAKIASILLGIGAIVFLTL